MVLARPRNRPPAPEPDPIRDPFAPVLAEPTPEGLHVLLGTFVAQESGWLVFHTIIRIGTAVAVLATGLSMLLPLDASDPFAALCNAVVVFTSPIAGLALWLRWKRRSLFARRKAGADALSEAVADLLAGLGSIPDIDPRLRRELAKAARPYPRLVEAIEPIAKVRAGSAESASAGSE